MNQFIFELKMILELIPAQVALCTFVICVQLKKMGFWIQSDIQSMERAGSCQLPRWYAGLAIGAIAELH